MYCHGSITAVLYEFMPPSASPPRGVMHVPLLGQCEKGVAHRTRAAHQRVRGPAGARHAQGLRAQHARAQHARAQHARAFARRPSRACHADSNRQEAAHADTVHTRGGQLWGGHQPKNSVPRCGLVVEIVHGVQCLQLLNFLRSL